MIMEERTNCSLLDGDPSQARSQGGKRLPIPNRNQLGLTNSELPRRQLVLKGLGGSGV